MDYLIDSHCHLTFDGLRERVDAVIERAVAAGVAEMVTVATDLVDAGRRWNSPGVTHASA